MIVEMFRQHSVLLPGCASIESVPITGTLQPSNTGFVYLQVPRRTVVDICKQAVSGSLKHCGEVAQLYVHGFGVGKDIVAAQDWASFATMQAGNKYTFEELVAKLREDVAEMTTDSKGNVIPNTVAKVRGRVRTLLQLREGEPESGVIVPRLRGIRVAVLYKTVNKLPVVAGVYTLQDGEIEFSQKMWGVLGVPRYFGEIRAAPTRLDFKPFSEDHKFFIVTGTITTPLSKLKARKKNFPNETVKSLYETIEDRKGLRLDDVRGVLGKVPDRFEHLSEKDRSYYLHFVAEEMFGYDSGRMSRLNITAHERLLLLGTLGFDTFPLKVYDNSCMLIRNGKIDNANVRSVVNAVSKHYAVKDWFVRDNETLEAKL